MFRSDRISLREQMFVCTTLLVALVVASLLVPSSAGAADRRGSTPTVTLRPGRRDLVVTGATPLRPGFTRFSETNATDDDHAIELARLHDGVTPEAYRAALETPDGMASMELGDFYGGVDDIPHHTTFELTVHLDPGRYVLFDNGQGPDGPDGPAWFTLAGYLRSFVVAGAPTDAIAPHAINVYMQDFRYDMPPTLPRSGVLAAVNRGDEIHMAAMLRLARGVTIEHAIDMVRNGEMPPGVPLELFGVTSPGHTMYRGYQLPPGKYLIACFMPDMDHGGIPHAMEGMIKGFTIK